MTAFYVILLGVTPWVLLLALYATCDAWRRACKDAEKERDYWRDLYHTRAGGVPFAEHAKTQSELKRLQKRYDAVKHVVTGGDPGEVPTYGAERAEAYRAIDSERDFQDALRARGVYDSADKSIGDYLTLICSYTTKACDAYTTNKGDKPAVAVIRKIAALCVAAMEDHGAPMRADKVH